MLASAAFEPLLDDGQIFSLAECAILVDISGREFLAAEPAFQLLAVERALLVGIEFVELIGGGLLGLARSTVPSLSVSN